MRSHYKNINATLTYVRNYIVLDFIRSILAELSVPVNLTSSADINISQYAHSESGKTCFYLQTLQSPPCEKSLATRHGY